ncbi:4-hydroxy-tetrahydrodipicolinate synthase [Streptomyces sp. DvalAA-14]|uniref:dihydrodipicolinate synthase family protein n=1 Tax=unclassified Streptomyces TaxID=2593676 RepID=UPI00081B9F8C|nr:4-hydroxy-tetrahydrodipicolinate synthase [Streptomyces sp. DvalAA-14]
MILVPLVTPFGPDGLVDTRALDALARQVLSDGASGLVALGTTGEAAALDDAERAAVAETVGRVCRERGARFVVGAGAGDTRRAARELRALAEGAVVPDAALVTVPSFTRPGEAGVLAHFRELAAAGPVPLIVYHVPYRTGQPLTADALRALAAIPGVTGVKYAAGGIDAETVDLLGDHPAGFEVLAGDDLFAPALFALGAEGAILASAHVATADWAELAATGDPRLGHRLARLAAALFREPNPTVLKALLHAHGRTPHPRRPPPPAPRGPRLPPGRRGGPVRHLTLSGRRAACPEAARGGGLRSLPALRPWAGLSRSSSRP